MTIEIGFQSHVIRSSPIGFALIRVTYECEFWDKFQRILSRLTLHLTASLQDSPQEAKSANKNVPSL